METKWISVQDKLPEIKHTCFESDENISVSDTFIVYYHLDGEQNYFLTTGFLDKLYANVFGGENDSDTVWQIDEYGLFGDNEAIRVTHYMDLPSITDKGWLPADNHPELTEQYFYDGDELLTDQEDLDQIKEQMRSKRALVLTEWVKEGKEKIVFVTVGYFEEMISWTFINDDYDTPYHKVIGWMPMPEVPKTNGNRKIPEPLEK